MFELQIELTGMCLVDLTATAPGSERYQGKAYLLGGRHKPRLTIPVHLVHGLDSNHVPPGSRPVVMPGGPILAEIDLTGCKVFVDDGTGPVGVELPHWDNEDPARLNDPNVDWRYLDYALDLEHQSGSDQLVVNPESVAAATIVLDRGKLTSLVPANPFMASALWDVPGPGKPTRTQPVAASLRWTIEVPGEDAVIRIVKEGQQLAGIVAGPVEGSGSIVPAAMYSLCELTGTGPGKLTDVEEYEILLAGGTKPAVPVEHTANVTPDASGCPPVRLVRR